MGLNEVFKRHRSLAYGLAITLAAIGLWLSTRVDFMLTKNVRAIEIDAAVDSIIEYRRMFVIRTATDSVEYRFAVLGASEPPILPGALVRGGKVDSIEKRKGVDSIALLRDGVWYTFRVLEPTTEDDR